MYRTLTAMFLTVSFLWCGTNLQGADPNESIRLFSGKDLSGWKVVGDGKWTVEDGILVARKEKSGGHGYLVTEKSYSDFALTIEFQSLMGDSGLYFRSEAVKTELLIDGLQAQLHPLKDIGGIYEFGGRKWVSRPDPELIEEAYQPGKWNTLVVAATGGNVRTTLNGHPIASLKNDPSRKSGVIALQLHGNQQMDVRFRSVTIQSR